MLKYIRDFMGPPDDGAAERLHEHLLNNARPGEARSFWQEVRRRWPLSATYHNEKAASMARLRAKRLDKSAQP